MKDRDAGRSRWRDAFISSVWQKEATAMAVSEYVMGTLMDTWSPQKKYHKDAIRSSTSTENEIIAVHPITDRELARVMFDVNKTTYRTTLSTNGTSFDVAVTYQHGRRAKVTINGKRWSIFPPNRATHGERAGVVRAVRELKRL